MKIIFLDIDGVLNADDDFYIKKGIRKGKRNPCPPSIKGYMGISKEKVEILARIVKKTDAQIVLVSTWKHNYEKYLKYICGEIDYNSTFYSGTQIAVGRYLYNKLAAQGLSIMETTQKQEQELHDHGGYKYPLRGAAINLWLDQHSDLNITNWIAIDDEPFLYTDDQVSDHLIKTDPYFRALPYYLKNKTKPSEYDLSGMGLTQELADKAIELLNKE